MEKKVPQIQEDRGLGVNGIMDEATFQELIAPLLQVLTPIKTDGHTLPTMILEYVRAHLAQHPLDL